MKKIFFKNKSDNGHQPFWNPWGFWGALWRLLVFLGLLFLFLLFLSLFKHCSGDNLTKEDIPEPLVNPVPPKEDPVIGGKIDSLEKLGPALPTPEPGEIGQGEEPGTMLLLNRLNVFFNEESDAAKMPYFANEFKRLYPGEAYQVEYMNPKTHLMRLIVPEKEREDIKARLPKQIKGVDFIVFNDNVYQSNAARPNDPVFAYQRFSWYFAPIQAYEAWDITQGSPHIKVAIIDSYFDLHHVELYSDRIEHPYSVPRGDNLVAPAIDCDEVSFMHGSMVASMAVGTMNNQAGACGIAPGCKFIPISMGHRFTSLTQMEGIMYAIDHGADVINISSGAVVDPRVAALPLEEQVEISKGLNKSEEVVWDYIFDRAERNNVTIVWAAGNESLFSSLDASKRNRNTIRVAALDENLQVADFSNFGNIKEYDIEESTISAPGVNMFGAMPFNTFNVGPGTSFSAPIVTGAVALMKSLDESLSNEEIIRILQETGKPVDHGRRVGPLLQIRDALLKVKKQFVSFEDILKDKKSLLGLWQSTELLDVFAEGKANGKARLYLDIQTPQTGAVYYKKTSNKEYQGKIYIKWFDDHIQIDQPDNATTQESKDDFFVPVVFTLAPDKNGLLKCSSRSSISQTTKPYYLKKVKDRK